MILSVILDLFIIGLFVFVFPGLTFIGVITCIILNILILSGKSNRQSKPKDDLYDDLYDDLEFFDEEDDYYENRH